MRGKLANGQDVGLGTIPGYSIRVVLLRWLCLHVASAQL